MANLQPLPSPGFAILPQYLSEKPRKVILKGHSFSKAMEAKLEDGTPLFTISGERFSISHRKAFEDAASGTKLFEIRKEGMGVSHYFAELSEDGPRLWESQTTSRPFHRPRTTIKFANQADANRPIVNLDFIPAGRGENGSFTWNGQMVTLVEKVSMRLAGEYHLSIAPGMDPALVTAVMAAMIDRAKTKANSAAAGGAAASA